MPAISVRLIDAENASAFEGWYSVVHASKAEVWPGEPGRLAGELRGPALYTEGPEERVLMAAGFGDETAGAAWVDLPRRDNLGTATASLHVHPAMRRRRVGTELLAGVENLV